MCIRDRRRETQRSLREDIGIGLTEDGHFDVEGKRYANWASRPSLTMPFHKIFVQDRCLLYDPQDASAVIDVKGRKLSNVNAPVDHKDNKQYVDYTCLRFITLTDTNDGCVVNARDHRIQSLGEPIRARDAANKGYVDGKVLPRDAQSNVSVGNVRITQLPPSMYKKDAVNLQFLNERTISLHGTFFNAQGKPIINISSGVLANDAAIVRQMEEVRQYAKSEIYKLTKVYQRRWEKLLSYIYKLHTHAVRSSLGAEEAELILANNGETSEFIEELDKAGEVKKDWRSVYEVNQV